MKILVLPVGSHGDVHPFLGLALALRERGHEIVFATSAHFRGLVERTGLNFTALGEEDHYERMLGHPDLWHPTRAFGFIFRGGIAPGMPLQYNLIAEHAAQGPVLVLANCLGFGARIAQERLGVPLATVHLQPSVMWSEFESPQLGQMLVGPRVPRWFKRFQYWIGETFFIDRVAVPETNRFRRELGLPPVRKLTRWWHSPDGCLGLFPDWFAPPQPDWPPQMHLTDFPLWDESTVHESHPELETFLAAGDSPIVFTPGSGNNQGAAFFAAAADACLRLNRRGLLLTRFPKQIPASLPPGVRHVDYAPFSRLLPRSAAIVHHGGIGTTAQGLRAGIPQLIMPLAHDQPDNAKRISKLGVGDSLPPARFTGAHVAGKLDRLLSSPDVRQSCRAVAGRFEGHDPFTNACELLEDLGRRRGLVEPAAMQYGA